MRRNCIWFNLASYLLTSTYLNILQRGFRFYTGYTGITLSVCPSVHLSVCGQNRVCSVSSRILIGSISYLHISSSNFRRCVACNARFKIQRIKILAIFFICNFDFVFFWLGIQYDSMVWVIMRRREVSSEHRRFSCSSLCSSLSTIMILF